MSGKYGFVTVATNWSAPGKVGSTAFVAATALGSDTVGASADCSSHPNAITATPARTEKRVARFGRFVMMTSVTCVQFAGASPLVECRQRRGGPNEGQAARRVHRCGGDFRRQRLRRS